MVILNLLTNFRFNKYKTKLIRFQLFVYGEARLSNYIKFNCKNGFL